MRILWLSWKSILHPDAGGAEIVGHENAKALVAAGHTVTWISLSPISWHPLLSSSLRTRGSTPSGTEKDQVSYIYIGHRKLMYTGLFHLFIFINYIINLRYQYDVIIDEIHGPPLLTPLYARKPIIAIIHEVAGGIWQKTIPQPFAAVMQHLLEPLMLKSYRNTPLVVGAETTKEDLVKLTIPADTIHLIPYGVEVPAEVQSFNYPKETSPTLIFLSALRPMKGFDRVYLAFKKLQNELPAVRLWVVGDDQTEHAHQMKELIAREGTKGITFYGRVDQAKKFELLQRAHILVHGSYKEGWGLVVIEANAMGTPAVVFDAAGLRNSIKQGENGYVSKDESEFVQHLKILLTDDAEREKLSQKAKNWSAQFSWDKATQQFLDLVKKILG